MCGRYVRRSDKQKIAEHFAVHGPSLPEFGPSWNVTPQTFQPIVKLNRDTGERELVLMRWGLIPFWAKDPSIGLRTINAKAETRVRIGGRTRTHWGSPHEREVYEVILLSRAEGVTNDRRLAMGGQCEVQAVRRQNHLRIHRTPQAG
jgi:hypothetical protein